MFQEVVQQVVLNTILEKVVYNTILEMKKEDMTKTMTLILIAGLTIFGGFDNGPG